MWYETMEVISSRNNPKIKQVRALYRRKARQEARLFFVEGIRPVGEAIEAGSAVEAIYYAPELLTSEFAAQLVAAQKEKGVACYATSPEVFSSLAEKENPQGILAVVRQPERRLEELNPVNFAWGVALVSPQDPGNLGAILRTVDAVGASGLILLESSVDIFNPAAVRASMGMLFWYPVVQSTLVDFKDWVIGNGYHVYGSSVHAVNNYLQIRPYLSPRILLLGSEREGLTPGQQSVCESVVRLPMHGRATSLNLAVAAGILLYAML
jgi:RNA methyltransferase, TrmH family